VLKCVLSGAYLDHPKGEQRGKIIHKVYDDIVGLRLDSVSWRSAHLGAKIE